MTGVEIIRSSVILNCFDGIEGIRLMWVQERMRSGIGDKYRQLLFLNICSEVAGIVTLHP